LVELIGVEVKIKKLIVELKVIVIVCGLYLMDICGVGFVVVVWVLVDVGDVIWFVDCNWFVFWIGIVFLDVFFGE